MTKELYSEKMVSKILASGTLLKPTEKHYIGVSKNKTLGEFLSNIKKDYSKTNTVSRFTFINKDLKWL